MKKILTIIFDGFGIREEEEGNAVKAAKMNNFNKIFSEYPHTLLEASEEAVGLHKGQPGNSEVGHMTIGAGKLLKQNEILVNEFLEKPDMTNERIKKLLTMKNKRVHLVGLCSDGNIHSGIDDFINMFHFLVKNDFKDIVFHLMTDGRDTGMHDAYKYIEIIEKEIKKAKVGSISTICGRYYGMDRDNNWDRTKIYYDLITKGVGEKSLSLQINLEKNYQANITDEFMKPIVASNKFITNGDVVIWMNYRADRAKQIMDPLVNSKKFKEFPVEDLSETTFFSLMPIDDKIPTDYFIEPASAKQPLGVYLSELDLTQARIAESEKYPHVTYFFDGGFNGKLNKCDKFEIPSPAVATYDLKPEMSCVDVTKRVIKCMESDYDFILVNYANPDMVGHTGNMEAATKACMAIDVCLGKLLEVAEENFYKIILLADHGNCDTMINPDKTPCTTHTTEKVPFIICDNKIKLKDGGSLTNVAPTILDYMDIAIPHDMEETESILIEE